MAQVIAFETDPSVSEVIDDILSYFEVEHVSFVVPPAMAGDPAYFLRILREHRPKLIITSFRNIGRHVLAAAQAVQSRPEIWLFTAYDEEVLIAQGALFLTDRVFTKPWGMKRIAGEAREFLAAAFRGSS